MASTFREFTRTFEEFAEKYPNHPMTEEIRGIIVRRRFPNEQWLKSRTNAMRTLMKPLWKRESKMSA